MDDTKVATWIIAETDRAIARLGARGHDIRVQQVVNDAVASAYRAGRADAWNGVYPIGTVADMLGVTTSHVRRMAGDNGIGEKFGRDWMFRESDVQALRALPKRKKPDAQES